jgi:hypothetical protein
MITVANLGENLMRQYPKKDKKSKLSKLYWNPSKAKKLKEKAKKRGFK